MTALEQVTNLKAQGKSEQEIANTLRQQGVSPKQITDSLSQSQVRTNVPNIQDQQKEMQASIMQNSSQQKQQAPLPPKPQDFPEEQENYMPEPYPSHQMQDFHPDSQQGFPDPYQSEPNLETENYDSNTMIDIAEQVLAEKMATISRQLDTISQSRSLSQEKINHMDERLKRMESIIDKLQIEILKKIGSYGENLQSIKGEMSMMQNSFKKIVNPLANRTTIPMPQKKIVKKSKV
jgi:hypothetical protein